MTSLDPHSQPTLAPHHLQMLTDGSGIPEACLPVRGWCTIEDPEQLLARGFNEAQSRLVPALAFPIWDIYGDLALWQIRPDTPRIITGHAVKYETPRGQGLRLDIHPSVQPLLANPTVPLWIVEGVKKGDSLAARGACTIALMGGVWGFRGRNKHGGKVLLPEWQDIPLNGRTVIIAYDSDIASNRQVARAAKALAKALGCTTDYLVGMHEEDKISERLPAAVEMVGA